MADSIVSPSPSVYRVDVVRGEQGDVFHVLRCEREPVARFSDPELAAFLVELLKGEANHG